MKNNFATGELYHVFNHGIEGRNIFDDEEDLNRYVQGMVEFNSIDPIGSIYENSFTKKNISLGSEASKLDGINNKLVNVVSYCLNPNHFHLILEQLEESGISKFMHRLGCGYTKYLNNKKKRRGALFEGVFKSKHIDRDEYLLHLSVYVNLNNRVHGLDRVEQLSLGSETSKLVKSRSSWKEYTEDVNGICSKDIILEQIGGKNAYRNFADDTLEVILNRNKEVDFAH